MGDDNGAKKTFLDLVTKHKYRLTFTEPILGMSPLNKEIYTKFITDKALGKSNNTHLTTEMCEDEKDMIQDLIEEKMTGFHRDDDGVYLLDYQV